MPAADSPLAGLRVLLTNDDSMQTAKASNADGPGLYELRRALCAAEADVALLLGFTAHEFAAPGSQGDRSDTELPLLLSALGLDEHRAARFLAERPGAAEGEAITDWLFRAPALAIAEARAECERPTWLYQFDWSGTAPGRTGQAYHCIDLPFAFDLLHAEGVTAALGTEPPQDLADAVHGAWVAFVRDLAPGAAWPPYRDGRATMRWHAEPRPERDPLSSVREIWLGATCPPPLGAARRIV
ncbi:carboxylesterase family protein [Kitasatospora sp. NPDC096204]|uniref:carboxylesterase family protein n=1 Tax=Kitasatospora sp. NPDC096204 TaxID=3364094 RepID=UPI00380EB429